MMQCNNSITLADASQFPDQEQILLNRTEEISYTGIIR